MTATSATPDTDIRPLLEARDLTVTRGERALLRRFNLQLSAGQGLHLVGANGAGKTSLLRVLAGLAHAAEGEVRRPENATLFLGHALGLKPELSVSENLAFFLRLRADAGSEPLMSIDAALREVKLAAYIDEPVALLSAGQKRRVGLARLCLEPARLWLLDEPFAALDVKSCSWLCARIEQFLEQGGALLLTSHQPVQTRQPLAVFDLGAS